MEISNGHNQEMTLSHSSASFLQNQQQEKKSKYKQDQGISCPRCESTNTKFCYYNNYSLSQPRYFCKGCRRYWTKGGMLRNVPVGGGCRKNKRSSSSTSLSSSPSSSSKNIIKPPSTAMEISNLPLPQLSYEPNNLALAFHPLILGNHNPNPNPSLLDFLRGGAVEPASQNHRGAAGFQSLWHGFGSGGNDQRTMLPFNGGSDSTTAAAAAATGMVVGNDDDDGGGGGENNAGVSLGLDPARDYWNGDACSSSWHGLDNSSFL